MSLCPPVRLSVFALLLAACAQAPVDEGVDPPAGGGTAGAGPIGGWGGEAPAPLGGSDGTTAGAGGGAEADADAGVAPEVDGAMPPPDAPAGKVPMFVAAGHGGRTVTSCDDGRTWIANHVFENRNEDHSPYTEKGFVYGEGLFVELMGWGAPVSAKISSNGVDWTRVDVPRGGGGGLVFLTLPKPLFVTVGGYGGCQSSSDGKTWSRCTAPNYPENLREAGGGGAAIGVGGDIAAVFSFDGGKQWRSGGPCSLTGGFGNLGQEGGFAWGNGVFVAVAGNGSWCQTADGGKSWKTGTLGGGAGGKMVFTGGRFWAPNGRDAHSSEDGITWTKQVFPAGVNIHALARGDSGTFVGVERSAVSNRFFRSEDGMTWTLVPGPGGTSLRRVLFGYGQPSVQCPLP